MADEPAGRVWSRSKFDWMDRVADDLPGRHLVFCVAHALLRDTNKATGITGIAQREIAEKIVAGLRSVQLAIEKLEDAGFLTVIKPKGPRLGNRYQLHLPPEPSKDPSLAQPSALKSDPSLAHPTALKEASLAHPDSLFSAAQCAPYPRPSPVEDHPRQGAAASPTQTTTIGNAEDERLLDEMRTAIEAAGGKLVRRRHNLQPVRALIAGGIPRAEVVAYVAAAASRLKSPLGNLDATWLLDQVRDRAAADGYGTGQPADGSTTAKPSDAGPKRRTPSGVDWPETRIAATTASGFAGGWWPEDWGPRPGKPGCEVDADLVERGRAVVVEAVRAWKAGEAWDAKLGRHPNSPSSPLAPDFVDGVQLRNGEWFTVGGLHTLLKVLAEHPEDFDWEFVKYFRALPSPLDNEDCTLTLEWQIKALEYRNAKL